MSDPIRVLHVDDDASYGALVADYLERDADRFEVHSVHDADVALDRIERARPDCIVSDYEMPGTDGIEFLETVRESYPNLPFVLFTGKGSEEIASDAIAAGATDYLQKQRGSDRYDLLANRVENAVDQYRSRRELERERSRMRFALESTAAAVWTLDVDTEAMELYPAVCPLFDVEVDSLAGFLDEVLPESRDHVRETVRAAARTGEPYSAQFRFRADGETRWGELIGRAIRESDAVSFQTGIVRDITPQKEQKRRFETLTGNLPGMVYRCQNAPEWPMEDVHGDVASFTGYTAGDLETGAVEWGSEVVHPEDRDWVWSEVQSSLDADESFEISYRIVTAAGETRWVWERGRGIDGPEDELEAIEGFITDITDRKRRERRLERQRERFERIAGVVSHDLRSPISAVDGRLRLARETGDLDHVEAAVATT
ncbi:MAG: PAS domain-containing protein, partial [Halolamina sp.]